MERVISRFRYRVGLQHNLSSTDIWTYREGQKDIGGYVEDVCDASTMEVGRVYFTGRVYLQQWVSRIFEDEFV